MNTRLSIFITLFFLISCCSNKHSLQSAKNLEYENLFQNEEKWLSQGKTEELLIEYKKLASKGDANAMARLGYFYNPVHLALGSRMPSDYHVGVSRNWYKQAATLGQIDAIERIASYYEEGIDGEQDTSEAYYWYAEGYEKAPTVFALKMYHLFSKGIGVEKNLKKATDFFQEAEKAAEKDSQLAANIGQSYLNGYNGLPKDTTAAKYWLNKALKLGDIFAELDLKSLEWPLIEDSEKLDSIALIVKERHKKNAKKN